MKKEYELGISRLRRLAEHLHTIDQANFNMWSWVGDEGDWSKMCTAHQLTRDDVISCGTTCCAFGHAATIPEFMEAGLRLVCVTNPASGDPVYMFEWDHVIVASDKVLTLANKFFHFPVGSTHARYVFSALAYVDRTYDPGTVVSIQEVIEHINYVIIDM